MADVRGLEDVDAVKVIDQIEADIAEAKDNLMLAKIFQADNSNRKQRPEDVYKENDLVMLSTANRRKDYMVPGSRHSTKLFPRRDGPYRVLEAFPQTSTYRLDIPNAPPNFCFTFHTSHLKQYTPNNQDIFPGQDLSCDGPITLADRTEEHVIERIIDERK